ncbi:MAG: hypothetical protein VX835_01025 [Pseudomonadota bacterium]|nr:hypothetical protein [Pseudomonadota bacterium]
MNNSKNTLFRDTESDDFYEIDKHEVPKGVKHLSQYCFKNASIKE